MACFATRLDTYARVRAEKAYFAWLLEGGREREKGHGLDVLMNSPTNPWKTKIEQKFMLCHHSIDQGLQRWNENDGPLEVDSHTDIYAKSMFGN